MKLNWVKKGHFFSILLLFLFALFIMLPTFLKPYHVGHDTKFHVANVQSIENQILEGNIPTSPILDGIGYGLGYGTRLFYPPLSHTFTAYMAFFLSHVNLNVLDSIKFVHFLILFLSGVTMYFLSYHLSKNKMISFFSAVIYMSFPYHISDIYVRDSLAECFLYPFLPLILLAVCELLEGNSKKFYPMFVFGYVGGILSHLTLMIYFTLFLVIFLLIFPKKVFKKEFLIPFFLACISIFFIVSFFLLGMLENRFFADYVVFEPKAMTKRIAKTGLYPTDYLNIFPFLQTKVKYHFSIIVLVLLLFTYLKRKQITFPKYTKNFLVFGLVSFFLSTKLFPWNFVPGVFQMIQFPWRLEIFVGLIVSLLAPLCLQILEFKKNSKYFYFLIFGIFLVCTISITISPYEEVIELDQIWWNGGMGWQKEYLPVVSKENKDYLKKKKQTISFVGGKGRYQILKNEISNLKVQLNVESSSVIELPRIYYPGYQFTLSSGEKIPLEMSEYGLLQAEIPKNDTYTLKYTGTFLNRVTRKLSILALLLNFIVYSINCYKRKDTKS